MKIQAASLISIVCLFAPIDSAGQAPDVLKEIARQNLRITKLLQPSAKQKVARAANAYENRVISSNWQVNYLGAAAEAVRSQFGNLSSIDINVLIHPVMFELWEAEESALKEMLEEMHRMNEAKKKHREYINHLKKQRDGMKNKMRGESQASEKHPSATRAQKQARNIQKSPKMATTRHLRIIYPKTPAITYKDTNNMTLAELDKYVDEMEHEMNSLGGISDELSLRLRIMMERRSEIIRTLSSILGKISQTADNLIANIK